MTLLNYYDKIRTFRCFKQLLPRTKGEASLKSQNIKRIEQCWTNCDACKCSETLADILGDIAIFIFINDTHYVGMIFVNPKDNCT